MIRRVLGIGALGAALAGCGAVDDAGVSETDGASESTGAEHAPILNGTAISEGNAANWGMVAVYHKYIDPDTGAIAWWPRPCSGTVVAVRGTSVYVTTARHCVTLENTTDGQLPGGSNPASSWIRVARGANPGVVVDDVPPTSVAATRVWAMDPIDGTWGPANDGALIRIVKSGWDDLMTANKAVYMGDPTAMAGLELAAFGYGVSSNQPLCNGNPLALTGAGKLRAADFFVREGARFGSLGSYSLINPNTLGQWLLCGDSGGPDLKFNFYDMPFIHLFGTHSIGGSNAMNTASGPWLSQMVGFILSPASDASRHIVQRADTVLTLTNDSSYTIFEYDPVAQQVYNRESGISVCLTWDISLNAFYLGACNSTDPWQKWTVTGRGYIRNVGSSLCMRHMVNGWVEPRNCPLDTAAQSERARFTWLWRGKI